MSRRKSWGRDLSWCSGEQQRVAENGTLTSNLVRVSGVEPCRLRQVTRFDFAQRDGAFFCRTLLVLSSEEAAPEGNGGKESRNELVAYPVNRDDVFGIGRIYFNLLSQLEYEIVDRAGADRIVVAPYLREEVIAGDGLVPMVPEILHDFKFFRCETEWLSFADGRVGGKVHVESAEGQPF